MNIMKKFLLVLALLTSTASSAFAHHNSNALKTRTSTSFKKDYKYAINTSESHVGHFYVKRSRANRKNERVRIEHTIHLENDVVKKFNVRFNQKTGILSYQYDMDSFTYFFNFYLAEGFLEASNPGTMSIFNKADNTFTIANVTLDPISEGQDDGHSGHSDGHSDS
jgi:hypothetical protein